MSTLNDQITTVETTIKQTSDKILDFTRELCKQILNIKIRKLSRKKICRQLRPLKRRASIINKHLNQLTQLRRQFRTLRKKYRCNSASAILAKSGIEVKKEPPDDSISFGSPSSYSAHGLSPKGEYWRSVRHHLQVPVFFTPTSSLELLTSWLKS